MQQCISEVNSTLPSEYLLFWVLCMPQIPLTVPSVLEDTARQTTRDNRGFLPRGIPPQCRIFYRSTAQHFPSQSQAVFWTEGISETAAACAPECLCVAKQTVALGGFSHCS